MDQPATMVAAHTPVYDMVDWVKRMWAVADGTPIPGVQIVSGRVKGNLECLLKDYAARLRMKVRTKQNPNRSWTDVDTLHVDVPDRCRLVLCRFIGKQTSSDAVTAVAMLFLPTQHITLYKDGFVRITELEKSRTRRVA